MNVKQNYPMPFTRLEVAVLTLIEGELHVLLVKRSEAPYAGKWALPGGVLRIDLDKSLDAAAHRVVSERLGVDVPFIDQLCAVGGPKRDPRAPWGLSIVYLAMLRQESTAFKAGKRVESLTWKPVAQAINDSLLAFDHASLVAQAVRTTRQQTLDMVMPAGLLEAQFTLGELQATCEQVLGTLIDKSSFRRKLADRNLVEEVKGTMRLGAFRPAKLFRLRAISRDQSLKEELHHG
jgi:ADP-ribose pyrophosphatase YjhB (NUDIX family)